MFTSSMILRTNLYNFSPNTIMQLNEQVLRLLGLRVFEKSQRVAPQSLE